MLFHRISLEAFCHATEDLEKVKEAILNLVPFEVGDKDFLVRRFEGSFGNQIILIRLEFDKQGRINKLIDALRSDMPESGPAFSAEEHVTDGGVFWLRFDKQEAYKGKITLGRHDTIQLKGKVAAFPASREKAVEIMEKAWS